MHAALRLERVAQGERRKAAIGRCRILGAAVIGVANVAAIARGLALAEPRRAGREVPLRTGRR